MNVQGVLIRVKRQFGDESGVQVTDGDIIRWINDAQNDIAQAQKILEKKATSITENGKTTYELPKGIIELKHVFLDDKHLHYLSNQDYNVLVSGDQIVEPGIPEVFTSWEDSITLHPTPNYDGGIITLYYSGFPDPVMGTTDELTLPERYHLRVLEACLLQAYELDENFEAATFKQAQFNNSMATLAGDEQWDGKEYYPSITVLPEDC